MSVDLSKGQRVSLDKEMLFAKIGLGWDVNKYDGGSDFDLDAAAFLLGDDDKVLDDNDFVFYKNLSSRDGAVIHAGDNLTGEGDGDDEVIMLRFDKMPAEVKKIAITVTIHEAESRGQNFGQVSNSYVRVVKLNSQDDNFGEEVMRFDLGEDFSIETSIIVCEIYRHGTEWKFNAVGSGYKGDLSALCKKFGVNV